jgi:CheY-like chemotaxis protein
MLRCDDELTSSLVCQLHGGDIGVSSKEGEGSTFGFFFKIRRSDGLSEDGRPTFQSRSNSENSQSSSREQAPQVRPGYNRANSNLTQIKERQNERPAAKTLTSHRGVDTETLDDCLRDPPTEYLPESHPESSEDRRYKETEKIVRNIQPDRSAIDEVIEDKLPKLQRGETKRQEQAAEGTSRSQSNHRAGGKQTLLLVEDNLINQKVLRRQLQSRGFEVFTANNGQEAIDAVANRGQIPGDDPNDLNYFDIILMDQEMPIKDGNTATQEIRQLQQEGKAGYSHIIGVSANVREAQTKSMREAGMDDVISKPYKVDDLVKRIQSIILEDGPSQNDTQKNSAPPIDTKANEEVRMLEDSPVRPRNDRNKHDAGGRAQIVLGGDAQEGKDKMKSNEGEQSGREGEIRGGERSRSRQER